jgi:hypothetical protein
MVPHGESVSLTAPEAFRFTFQRIPGGGVTRSCHRRLPFW